MFNKNGPLVAKKIPPRLGKGVSFQVINLNQEQREELILTMRSDEVKQAHPFLQGDQDGWLMIEFWSQDAELVEKCCKLLAQSINVDITGGDDFTRKELGLE